MSLRLGYEKTITLSSDCPLSLSLSLRSLALGKASCHACFRENQVGAKERRGKVTHREEQRKRKALSPRTWRTFKGKPENPGACVPGVVLYSEGCGAHVLLETGCFIIFQCP